MTQKKATDFQVGDVLEVPGWMLHEDLSGLWFEIRIVELVQDRDWIGVKHRNHEDSVDTTWFKPEESAKLLRAA